MGRREERRFEFTWDLCLGGTRDELPDNEIPVRALGYVEELGLDLCQDCFANLGSGESRGIRNAATQIRQHLPSRQIILAISSTSNIQRGGGRGGWDAHIIAAVLCAGLDHAGCSV